MLSHGTAVWWYGWLQYPPGRVHVATPRRLRTRRRGPVIHDRCRAARRLHRGFPITPPAQTLLHFAADAAPDRLRLALAGADHAGQLDLAALAAVTGRGIRGSASLRVALRIHRPELAFTRSELERRMILLAERHGLPIPRCNVMLHGWLVDAVWSEQRVVVELDGINGHRTAAQLRRDDQRDLELRLNGYVVLRYTWEQVTQTPELVAADLGRALARAA
jgi:very-short-patch-repair endonuclease